MSAPFLSKVKAVQPKHTFCYDGTRVNIFHASKGEGLPRHDHVYSHATVVYNGKVKCTKENFELIMDKNTTPIVLKGGEWHELEAMEDETVFSNIFAEEFMKTDTYNKNNNERNA